MYYEDKVTSFPDLARRLRSLDQDAGLRVIGGSGKQKILMFVTRFGPKYTIMTYTLRRKGTPGRRLQTLELENFEGVEEEVRKAVKGQLQAWVY
ncbi:MAG TPA: hypothetical protein VKF15_08175 [Nitrososphaerales archaeon]|nr:hypothetical protein [Nitrososphaerales archaeon]